MRYFFIQGREPLLSKAELEAVLESHNFKNFNITLKENFILLDIKNELEEVSPIFNKLGGFISFGVVYENIDDVITQYIEKSNKTKAVFGFSIYTDQPSKYNDKEVKQILEYIKIELKNNNIPARYIIPNGLTIDSGRILGNRILEKGFEIVVLEDKDFVAYGKTIAVQDIDLYSTVEYDKPFTDKDMGVLPSKLAQIMINLSGAKPGDTIWDPFCGSGTILLMGLLNGNNVLGSDIDPKGIAGSTENINWLASNIDLKDLKYQVFELDINKPYGRTLTLLKRTEVQAIVCEPYMGPPQYKVLSTAAAKIHLENVEKLYSNLFEIIMETRKRDCTIVLVAPSYKTREGWLTLQINKILPKRWEIKNIERDLHWKRTNSIIKRNILIIKSKSS